MSGWDYRYFIKLHDGFPEHRKTAVLSDRAFRRLIEAWCYCNRTLSDGHIPKALGDKMFSRKVCEELTQAGWVARSESGYEMLGYLEHQSSAEQVADLRRKRSAAGSKGGKAAASARASAKQVPKQTASKIQPEVEREVEEEGTIGTGSSAAHVSNAREPEQHLSRSFPANVVLIANRYTDKVKLSDRTKVCNVVDMALRHGYLSTKVEDALSRLADSGMPVTPDTLRIEIEGKRAASRASPQQSTSEVRANQAWDLAQQIRAEEEAEEMKARQIEASR